MSAPRKMSRRRMVALLEAADKGLDELAYDFQQEGVVDITGTKAEVRKEIDRERDGGTSVGVYEVEDVLEAAERYHAGTEAVRIMWARLYPGRA